MDKTEGSSVRTEKCIQKNCGKDTGVPVDTHVDLRLYYIDGAGDLCKECYEKIYGPLKLSSTKAFKDDVI